MEFILGVAVGAAFAPFWMGVWRVIYQVPFVKTAVGKVKAFFA